MSNFDKICRTCLIIDQSLIAVSSVLEKSFRIQDYFLLHLNLTVSESDELPPNICLACLDKLLQIRKFNLQCVASENYLKNKVAQNTGNILVLSNQGSQRAAASQFGEDNYIDPADTTGDSIQYVHEKHLSPSFDEEWIEERDTSTTETVDNRLPSVNEDYSQVGRDFGDGPYETFTESYNKNGSSSVKTAKADNESNDSESSDLSDVASKFFPSKQTNIRKKKPIYCLQCHETFDTKNSLRKHFNSVHGDDNKNGQCLICRQQFPTRGDLMNHLRSHQFENVTNDLVCSYCSREFRIKAHYIAHIRTHTGERPYDCKVCGKAFVQRTALSTHMTLHNGKPISCSMCDKKFSVRSKLILHFRVHNGEKPFACDQCPKRFRTKSLLKTHLLTHTGIKEASCHLCGITYMHMASLRIHMYTHTRKPYSCPKCKAEFVVKWRFRKHLISNHNIHDDPSIYKRTNELDESHFEDCIESNSGEFLPVS